MTLDHRSRIFQNLNGAVGKKHKYVRAQFTREPAVSHVAVCVSIQLLVKEATLLLMQL